MRATQHPSNNDVLGAPPGVPIEECRPLYITRVRYPDGTPAVMSFWQPSEAEKAAIAAGACVSFMAIGHTHPPMQIAVDGVACEGA